MALPTTGDSNWGIPLNDFILNTIQAAITSAQTELTTHKIPNSDPHLDRAFSASQLNAVTATFDAANGRAGLGADGRLKPAQAPLGGGYGNTYDCVKDYGATGNGSTNDAPAIQAALNAAAAAGGGEVWLKSGTYIINAQINMGANTHLRLSPGATIKRGTIASAQFMITNWAAASTSTAYNGPGNLRITGGTIDGGGVNNSLPVTGLCFAHANGIFIDGVDFINMVDYGAIALVACKQVRITDCRFRGLRVVQSSGWTARAVRLSFANTTTAITGVAVTSTGADNVGCDGVYVTECYMDKLGTFSSYGSLVSADLVAVLPNVYHVRVYVSNNTINFANDYAIMAPVIQHILVDGNTFDSCNGGFWSAVPSNYTVDGGSGYIDISNNQFNNSGAVNNSTGVLGNVILISGLYTPATTPTLARGHGAHITDNQLVSGVNTAAVIAVSGMIDTVVSGNKMYGFNTSATCVGISLKNCFISTVVGNQVRFVGANGILLSVLNATFPGAGCSGSVVSSNIVQGTGATGILLSFSADCVVSSNHVRDTAGTNSISFANSSLCCVCVGNRTSEAVITTGSTGCVVASNANLISSN